MSPQPEFAYPVDGLTKVIADLGAWDLKSQTYDDRPDEVVSDGVFLKLLLNEVVDAVWEQAAQAGAKVVIEAVADQILLDALVIGGECFMQVTVFEDPCFHVRVPIDEALEHNLSERDRSVLATKLRQIADELDAEQEE